MPSVSEVLGYTLAASGLLILATMAVIWAFSQGVMLGWLVLALILFWGGLAFIA